MKPIARGVFKKHPWRGPAAFLVACFFAVESEQSAFAQVQVEVFQSYVDTGAGVTFSDPVGTFNSPDAAFLINYGLSFHPHGLASFGARITGNFYTPIAHTQTFALDSSDGSYLFLNGTLNVNNGGVHGVSIADGTPVDLLAYDPNPFEIQFYKSPGGGPSGVDLGRHFQSGGFVQFSPSSFVPVPEPANLFALGVGAVILMRRRRDYMGRSLLRPLKAATL